MILLNKRITVSSVNNIPAKGGGFYIQSRTHNEPHYIQVNIVITRSLGSNELNRVISESCCLVCTGVTCYVTAITYKINNNIIKELS